MALQLDDGTFVHVVDADGFYSLPEKNAAFKALSLQDMGKPAPALTPVQGRR